MAAKRGGLQKKAQELLFRLKELQGSPAYLAKGVALGIFIGFAPLMPLKSLLILSLSFIISANPIAALLVCTVICNPITYIPLYYLAWLIGDLLLPGLSSWEVIKTTVTQIQQSGLKEALALSTDLGLKAFGVMLVGGTLAGIIPALASYPVSYRFFANAARRKIQKQAL